MRDRPDELVVRVDTERGQSGALSAIRPSREAHEQRQIRALALSFKTAQNT